MNVTDELKPCPFCGGAAKYIRTRGDGRVSELAVQCSKCWARSGSDYGVESNATDRKDVADRWNARVTESTKSP